MESNFLSGTSKIMEAFLIATSIAGGVGIILTFYHNILSMLGRYLIYGSDISNCNGFLACIAFSIIFNAPRKNYLLWHFWQY